MEVSLYRLQAAHDIPSAPLDIGLGAVAGALADGISSIFVGHQDPHPHDASSRDGLSGGKSAGIFARVSGHVSRSGWTSRRASASGAASGEACIQATA